MTWGGAAGTGGSPPSPPSRESCGAGSPHAVVRWGGYGREPLLRPVRLRYRRRSERPSSQTPAPVPAIVPIATGAKGTTIMNMTAHIRQMPDRTSIAFTGDLDIAVRQRVRDALRRALGRARTAIEIDLDQVRLLDCSTLAVILTVRAAASRRGVALTVSNPHGIVRQVLEITDTLALLTGYQATHPIGSPVPGSPRIDGRRPTGSPNSCRPHRRPARQHPDAGADRGWLDGS